MKQTNIAVSKLRPFENNPYQRSEERREGKSVG